MKCKINKIPCIMAVLFKNSSIIWNNNSSQSILFAENVFERGVSCQFDNLVVCLQIYITTQVPKLSLKLQYSFNVISLFDSLVPLTYKNLMPRSSAHSIDSGIKTYTVDESMWRAWYFRGLAGG